MSQNTSHAVMAQRHEPHDSLDYFATPAWGTRALCEHVLPTASLADCNVWEPACGEGHMAEPLREYFLSVHTSDIHDYDWEGQERVVDFLFPGSEPPHIAAHGVDWIITNPPFKLAAEFVHQALDRCDIGCAMLCRTVWLEGQSRYRELFSKRPPSIVAVFSERLPINKGAPRVDAGTATSYSWFVWFKRDIDIPISVLEWVPPCRKALEREGDYPTEDAAA